MGSSEGGSAERTRVGGRGRRRVLIGGAPGAPCKLLFTLRVASSASDGFVQAAMPRSSYMALEAMALTPLVHALSSLNAGA